MHRHGHARPRKPDDRLLAMRDLMDLQIETSDGVDIGRVDDVETLIDDDGQVTVTALLAGPQALAGRVSSRLQPLVRRLLRDRFDTRIPMDEVAELGLVIRLRGRAEDYRLGASDRAIGRWLSRIPGGRHRTSPEED